MCGVYYLWDGAEVLYVGASMNIEKRISRHRTNKLDFAGYFVDECEPSALGERELAAIREFKPKYNVTERLYPMR